MNLRGLGQAMAIYASQSNDMLPESGGAFSGNWLCDVSTLMADSAEKLYPGAKPGMDVRKYLYCPGNAHQDVATLWGAGGDVRTIGYVWLPRRAEEQPKMPVLPAMGEQRNPVAYREELIGTRYSSTAVMAGDWIVSDRPSGGGIQWTGIRREGSGAIYDTSHLMNGGPQGQNLLCFDGHVEWEKFDAKVLSKGVAIPQGEKEAGPYFWIVPPAR